MIEALTPYAIGAFSVVVTLLGVWLKGRRDGQAAAEAERLQQEAQARKRSDDAASQYRADGAVERLRRGTF